MSILRIGVYVLLVSLAATHAFADASHLLKKKDGWFQSDEAQERLANILTHQDTHGCWPKNTDTSAKPFRGKRAQLSGTFDNGATTDELRLLARAYTIRAEPKYERAFDRGLKCILDTQYDNGGWPQIPKSSGYHRHITFNDGAMFRLMTFLRDIGNNKDNHYRFVKQRDRFRALKAFDQGIQCILDCQIRVDGELTAWCAQHDEKTLEPRGARVYEHVSISGGESAEIACLLMSVPNPTKRIQDSVRGVVQWFSKSAIVGYRYDRSNGTRKLVGDSKSTVWARFYDIRTNRPIFSGRDGVIKYDVAEIEPERRNGYAWYVTSGKKVAACWDKWQWK